MFPLSFNNIGTVPIDSLGFPSFGATEPIALNQPLFTSQFGLAMDTFDLTLMCNQAQLQSYFFAMLDSVMKNPLVDHTIPDNIKKNFRPFDYNRYGESGDKISKLSQTMQEKTMKLLDYAKSQGMEVSITSGYRTESEQAELRRKKPNLAAKKSLHCQGKAIDIKIKNGTDADYKKLGDYAKSLGMRWGGDFKNPCAERWHFDLGHS